MIDLTNYYCAFSHRSGSNLRYFQLQNGGEIVDIDSSGNDNERYWDIKEDSLILYNKRAIKTATFELNKQLTKHYDNKRYVLDGLHKETIQLRIIAVKNPEDVLLNKTEFCHWDDMKDGLLSVGNETYGNFLIEGKQNAKKISIGSYTTIRDNVRFVFTPNLSNHVSSFKFYEQKFIYSNLLEIDDSKIEKDGSITIGNDVYISDNCQISSNSIINDGAIILANSTVNTEIPPYAIVSGTNCSVIGYRFTKEQIEKLLKINWWNWDINTIKDRVNDIRHMNIDAFISKYSR